MLHVIEEQDQKFTSAAICGTMPFATEPAVGFVFPEIDISALFNMRYGFVHSLSHKKNPGAEKPQEQIEFDLNLVFYAANREPIGHSAADHMNLFTELTDDTVPGVLIAVRCGGPEISAGTDAEVGARLIPRTDSGQCIES